MVSICYITYKQHGIRADQRQQHLNGNDAVARQHYDACDVRSRE